MKKDHDGRETFEIESDKKLMRRIKKAEKEVMQGKGKSLDDINADLAAFDDREKEPSIPFEAMKKELKKKGRI